jgi:LuxR family maltose regulon positive regulatory protein
MGADARLALDLHELDEFGLCMAECLLALSDYLSGLRAEARSAFEAVEHQAQASGAHQPRVLALSELALLATDDGDWDRALELANRAMTVVRQHGLQGASLLSPAHCTAALVAAHFQGSERAAALVQQAYGLFAVAVDPPTWSGVQCRETLARAELVIGDAGGARILLSEAQGLLSQADSPQLRDRVDLTWRRIAGRPLEATPGSTLTRAELRVLQLLPTHLSFAQIGQQLFVSRNTVKTQAVSAYRKLDVGSRSEAVEKGRALGLIVTTGQEA